MFTCDLWALVRATALIQDRLTKLKFIQDSKSVAAAAKTLSLSFSSDPLICWLYRDPAGPRWDSLLPALQRWQEFRIREYILAGIGMEVVTQEATPTNVGVCFLYPPGSQYRWLRPWWWGSYLRYFWDFIWNRPSETLGDEKASYSLIDSIRQRAMG